MELSFANKDLEKLYTEGRSKKYKLPAHLIKKYTLRLQTIHAAENIYDFWQNPALNFEKLQGTYHTFSMRLDRKWRLILILDFQDEAKTIAHVSIEDVNNHYES
jgi:plasmid maintenance system killer protein